MRRALIILSLLLAGLALSACSSNGDNGDNDTTTTMGGMKGDGGENATTVPGARQIDVTATSFEFTPKEITIAAGEDVTIALTANDVFHDFFVEDDKGHVVGAEMGKTEMGGLRIDKPGTYKFWCTVSGHRTAGMEGTIIVQ